MGVGEAARDSKLIEGAVRDLDRDHRPEAAGDPGPQVHRAVQAARGHADRRARHAARRPDVGVHGPAAVAGAAAHPRLPRPLPAPVRRPRQLHLRSHRAGHVPRDRPGPGRPVPRHGHHRRDHRDDTTTRDARCSSSSASPSGSSEQWPRHRLKVKAARKPKFKVRGYTRCQRCGRPKAVYRKFGLCRICLREMAHRGELPA